MRQKEDLLEVQALAQDVVTEMVTEVVRAPFRLRTYKFLRKILLGFIFVSTANVVFSSFFYTPKMFIINNENRELTLKYRILEDRIRTAQRKVNDIHQRNNNVYSSIFSTDTLTVEGIHTPYPDSKYAHLTDDEYASTMISTWRELDALARTIYLESVCFDEMQTYAKNKEQMSLAVPAIWPIDRAKLRNNHIGAFNPRRMHPILRRIMAHTGVDFGCDKGTPVYATGDAIVEIAATEGYNGGYGKQIVLNHEFGYETRYAHLDRVMVKPGERVVRGQVIGHAGNTGRSTAAHLHYEVVHKGKPVNPVNYFDRNMTNQEYDRIMEQMRETNYEIL